jgi:hypothetical protein
MKIQVLLCKLVEHPKITKGQSEKGESNHDQP